MIKKSKDIMDIMVGIIKCKCGKQANNLVVYKGSSVNLCSGHIKALEVYLGETIEPITTVRSLINGLFFSYRP